MKRNLNERPIGVFDSGIGGLTVLKQIIKLLPKENTIYLGDTARVPYGTKSPDTVIKYTFQNVEFLLKKHIKLLVVACNTASAHALELAREKYRLPIIGVIQPGVNAALNKTRNKRIGVIGTKGTIESSVYRKALLSQDSELRIFSKACPVFVSLAEDGLTRGDIPLRIVAHYLKDLKAEKIDNLILGCTHYPLLKKTIKSFFGNGVNLVDSSIETAKEVKKILDASAMLKSRGKTTHGIFITDTSSHFVKTAKLFLGGRMEFFHQVDI